jgi:synaptic vesicle membrane protein VAT-1
MRALVNTKFGGYDVLKVEDRPVPSMKSDEVLIKVKRAGLNFADVSARVGLYPDAPKFPAVMGYEVSGVVEKTGSDVKNIHIGQRVFCMCRFGGQAEYVSVTASQVRGIPDDMSFDVAAAMPVNYITAWHMLKYVAPIQPGMQVLIHMAAGGVGVAAIQLCKAVENVTIIGSASAPKHEYLKSIGVHHCIDYRTEDYVEKVKALTNGKGVHRIIDALGGPDWSRGYSILRKGGHLLAFGWANMVDGDKRSLLNVAKQMLSLKRYSPMELMDKNRGVSGVNMGHMWDEGELMGQHLDGLLAAYTRGEIKPQVDSVFKIEEGGKAHERLQSRKSIGKVLLSLE